MFDPVPAGHRAQHHVILRLLAAVTAALVGATLLTLSGVPSPSVAESNTSSVYMSESQTQYAYLAPGDTLSLSFTKEAVASEGSARTRFKAYDPAGVEHWDCVIDTADPIGAVCATPAPLSGAAGVWEIEITNYVPVTGAMTGYDWNHTVVHEGAPILGRIWSNEYRMWQPNSGTRADLAFWAVSDAGYKYSLALNDYNGIFSQLLINAAGVTPTDSCTSYFRSVELAPINRDCTPFRLFFEEPAADLPPTAPSRTGDLKIMPPLLDIDSLAVSDLVFTPSRGVAGAGTFDYSITPYFQGNYWVEIDIDGNGSYTDPVDRRIQQGADGSGAYETEFDGIDGEGNPIDECGQMRARIYYDRLGEIHVVQRDVEVRGGGIELIRQNGPGAPNDTIYWDDTHLDPNRQTTTPEPNGTAGIASTGGVHGWQRVAGAAPVSWGDARSIDDWTYVPITQGTGEIAIDGRCLSVTKATDATSEAVQGDIATYTVSVTNTGTGDYTEADPAIIVDDMTSLLDDATFNDDAVASDGSVTFADNKLTWTGPLPSGDTVTLTYSVTITNAGDHQMKNVASVTPEQCLGGDPRCTAITETPLPHIVSSKSSDPASGTTLGAGEELTYTLSFTNDGASAGPIDSTDDLTAVLDDADVTVEPVSDTSGITATRTGSSLRIVGDLAPNTTAHITYTVKVRGSSDRGDGQLRNILIPDDEVGGCAGTDCETQHTVGELDVWKTVDPASGATVPAGEVLTYKLHFSNLGEAPMPVDHEDVLVGILDDADVTSAPVVSDAALSASAIAEGRFGVTGVLKPGQVVTVTYQVTVRADDARGDGVLANFLVPRGGDPVCDANNRTCTANPVGAVSVVKTSDPASGSAVTEGEQVTYTLTFMNTSPAGSSPAPVSFTDHMTDVLDDATFDGRPVSSAKSITASFADEKITIDGELGQGETATVTYTVRVKSYADQGNRRLGNVVAHTGMDPICVAGSKLCTQHDIFSTTLSHTGSEGQMSIIVGASALLVLGSGAFVFARIRRRKTVQQLNSSTLLG